MTNETNNRDLFIPFSATAKAAEISQKRIRNWLDNQNVYLDADEWRTDPGKHRRFSRLDVARLGLVARLTTLGFSAERASYFVEREMYGALCIWRKKNGTEKAEEHEEKVVRDHFRPVNSYKIPRLRFERIMRDHRKLAEKHRDLDPKRPDSLTLSPAETVAMSAESEILDALRDSVMFIEVIGYDVEEYFGSADEQPNYVLYVQSKDSDLNKKAWSGMSREVDTRVSIEIWRMMESQDEALKTIEEEE